MHDARRQLDPRRSDPPDQAAGQPQQLPAEPAARIIARALKRYGAVVGDRSGVGNNVTIKLEDTAVEGKGNLWANAGLRFDSLRNIPLSAYRIDRLGAGR